MSLVALWLGHVEFRIFVLAFFNCGCLKKTITNIRNSTRPNRWATKDISCELEMVQNRFWQEPKWFDMFQNVLGLNQKWLFSADFCCLAHFQNVLVWPKMFWSCRWMGLFNEYWIVLWLWVCILRKIGTPSYFCVNLLIINSNVVNHMCFWWRSNCGIE